MPPAITGRRTLLGAVTAMPLAVSGPARHDFLAEQNARWAPIIRGANIRLD